MKFLLSLALIVVLASARGKGPRGGMDLFRPVPDCTAEKTEEQVAKMEKELDRLRMVVQDVCELETEEAEADVGTQSVGGRGKQKRGRKGGRKELEELVTEDRCVTAKEDLESVVQEISAELDPCTTQYTADTLVEKQTEMCTESESSSESSEDEEAKEKRKPSVCDMSEEDLRAAYLAFFNAEGAAVNRFEFDAGVSKMKLMAGLDAHHKENCVKEEEETVVEETETVEDAEEVVAEDDQEEEEPTLETLARRLLKGRRGGHKGRGKSEEPKELPASMQLVADFKEQCTEVSYETVNSLVTDVQEAMEAEKAAREAEESSRGRSRGGRGKPRGRGRKGGKPRRF